MTLAGRLLNADLLYQAEALDVAARRLMMLVASVSDQNARISALCRLTEIACDGGDLAQADELLTEMQTAAERAGALLSGRARAELIFARARRAFSRCADGELTQGAGDLLLSARRGDDSRIWSLAARINAFHAVDRYHRRDLTGAAAASRLASAALQKIVDPYPFVKTHVLTTQAVVDLHDPARVHLVIMENMEALELALRSGMVSTAYDALYNIVSFWLDCDEARSSTSNLRRARELVEDAMAELLETPDSLLGAVALAVCGRLDEAIERIGPEMPQSVKRTSEWLPIFIGPVAATKRARILFKARRFAEAERAAAAAVDSWGQSGLGGEGTALRIRAEALEAQGQRRSATKAVEDAIAALQPLRPVHHMVAAYKCAHRLTGKRSYRDQVEHLEKAVRQSAPDDAPPRLTSRERQIARLVSEGYSNKAIASHLGISHRTVANHVAGIFSRLGIRARWQLTPESADRG